MIGLILTAIVFVIIWMMSFLLHELCHIIEAMRQGISSGHIRVWKFGVIPSFVAEVDEEIPNKFMFALSGGLYSGLLLAPLAIISNIFGYTPFAFAFTTTSITNLAYSIFESKCLFSMDRTKYMILHYMIYAACVLFMVLVYIKRIMLWV